MKKTLILVRHATAEDQTLVVRDFQRELTAKGKNDALVIGKWLSGQSLLPGMLITSAAPRAYQTAVIIGDQLRFDAASIVKNDNLYDGGPRAYLTLLNGLEESLETVMVFGHNPDITYFAEYLSGGDFGGSMSKCSVAMIGFDDLKWEEISSRSGNFISYTTPKQLRDL